MNATICQFSFNICRWNIACNKMLTPDDWKAGKNHWLQHCRHQQNIMPELAFLAPMKRRRLNDSARLFFEAAWILCEPGSNLPVVYASQNSEVNRSFALWKMLLQEGCVSPTSFSLSVHNALVGQWSEMQQVKAETTALTAQKDNLETALTEAYLLLNDGYDKVLVVVMESPLSENYNVQPIIRQPFAYALAMIVEKGEQYQLSLHTVSSAQNNTDTDTALIWVQAQHLQQSAWHTPGSRGGIWQWHKN